MPGLVLSKTVLFFCTSLYKEGTGQEAINHGKLDEAFHSETSLLFNSSLELESTELAKKVSPRLRDLAIASAGGITQPRTHFFGQLCSELLQIGTWAVQLFSSQSIISRSVDDG